jgi:hypothetical protein
MPPADKLAARPRVEGVRRGEEKPAAIAITGTESGPYDNVLSVRSLLHSNVFPRGGKTLLAGLLKRFQLW